MGPQLPGLLIAISLALAPAAAGKAPLACGGRYDALAGDLGAFADAAPYEAASLLGEAPSELGAFRRKLTKELTADPERATRAASALKRRGLGGAGGFAPTLLALDVLAKTKPGAYVDAVAGILTRPVPAAVAQRGADLALFKVQLGSRLLSQLAALPPADGLRLADLLARSPWLRTFVGEQPNAARTMLNLVGALKKGDLPADELKGRAPALRTLAEAWINPRLAETRSGRYKISTYPETDWAFSLVLAHELAKFLEPAYADGARALRTSARELQSANVPAAFRANPRVQDLFREFAIEP